MNETQEPLEEGSTGYDLFCWFRLRYGMRANDKTKMMTYLQQCPNVMRHTIFFFRIDFHVSKWTCHLICKVLTFTLGEILVKM